MLQFVSILVYNCFGYFYFGEVCGKKQTGALAGSLTSAAIFLALFYSFYQQAYNTKKRAATAANSSNTSENNKAAAEENDKIISSQTNCNLNRRHLNTIEQ